MKEHDNDLELKADRKKSYKVNRGLKDIDQSNKNGTAGDRLKKQLAILQNMKLNTQVNEE